MIILKRSQKNINR